MPGERDVARLTRRQLLRGLGASGLLLTAAPAAGLPVPHEVPGRTAVHHGTFGLR